MSLEEFGSQTRITVAAFIVKRERRKIRVVFMVGAFQCAKTLPDFLDCS